MRGSSQAKRLNFYHPDSTFRHKTWLTKALVRLEGEGVRMLWIFQLE
jgi:hypothetical protein